MANDKIKDVGTIGFDLIVAAEKFLDAKEYRCANPDAAENGGPLSITDCEQKYFQGYDGVTFKPGSPEPSDSDLESAFNNLKGCTFIKDNMGAQYLGCFPEDPSWEEVWNNNVKFAVLVDNLASNCHVKMDYASMEINKAENDVWVDFPWEDWWTK